MKFLAVFILVMSVLSFVAMRKKMTANAEILATAQWLGCVFLCIWVLVA